MDEKAVRNWMIQELEFNQDDYLDCDEINCTSLAENAAQALDLYQGDDAEIPEEVFDLAVEVAEQFE